MDNVEILGYFAGTLVMLSLLPQAIKSWKTKSTKDISLGRYVMYVAGLSLWIAYAFAIGSNPLMMMASVELLLALSILALKVKYG